MASAVFYVQLIPSRWGDNRIFRDLKVGPVTKGKPARPVADAYTVRVRLEVPDEVFLDDIPALRIDVPAGNVRQPIVAGSEPIEEAA